MKRISSLAISPSQQGKKCIDIQNLSSHLTEELTSHLPEFLSLVASWWEISVFFKHLKHFLSCSAKETSEIHLSHWEKCYFRKTQTTQLKLILLMKTNIFQWRQWQRSHGVCFAIHLWDITLGTEGQLDTVTWQTAFIWKTDQMDVTCAPYIAPAGVHRCWTDISGW